jgi:PKD repeat protein
MQRLLLFISIFFSTFLGVAQNQIQAYEYWFDDDYSAKVVTSVSPVQQLVLSTSIPTSSLSNGIHTFNFRAIDIEGMHSSVLSQFFYKIPESVASATNDLVAYEYWFNNDYASAQLVATPVQSQVQLNELISASALTDGIHTFSIRFKDESGMWSSVLSQFFYKIPESVASATNDLVAYEYWFDNNYASAQLVATPVQSQVQLNELISATSLTDGIHTFNIRFKDESGMWSSVLRQFFYKIPESVASATNDLVAYEYWFDNDYASAQLIATPVQSQVQLNELISAIALTDGIHTFSIRFKDELGMWSSVLSQFFYKVPPVQTIDNYIVAYRYWLDDEFQDAVFVQLATPVQQLNLVDNLDFTMIPKDEYLIHFQFKDTLGFWSSVLTDTIEKTPLPIPIFAADSVMFCDAGTVQFINSSIDGDEYLWDFGDGNTSTDVAPIHTYNQPGNYTVSLTAYDLSLPIDSTVAQMDLVVVFETPDASLILSDNDTICEGIAVDISAVSNGIFEWSTSETTQSITVNQTGEYWVNIANNDFAQCNQNSDTIQITVIQYPDATIALMGNDTICENTSVELLADAGYVYEWSNGATSSSIFVSTSGDFAVTVYDADYPLCFTESDTVTITVIPLPVANFEFSNSGYEVDFTNLSSDASDYFWNFGDGNTSTDFEPSHTYETPDMFNVFLVASSWCGADTMYLMVDLEYLSLDQMQQTLGFKLYPNPSSGVFFLESDFINEDYVVLDAQGRIVQQGRIDTIVESIDLSFEQTGIYFLVVNNKVMRLVKH